MQSRATWSSSASPPRPLSEELQLVAAAVLAGLLTLGAVPLARLVAVRTNTLDHPVSYKAHGRSTPYLGGAAVIISVVLVAGIFSRAFPDYDILLLVTLALCALGTLDDRVGLPVAPRFIAQGLAAIALYTSGIDWDLGAGAGLDVAVTVLWVIGVVNAFNLMDNLDGATGATGAVAALGVGILAAIEGVWPLAELMIALSASCFVFLLFNLSSPARIFLGDGGSMPIGFLVAGGVMAIPHGAMDGWALPAMVPLAGLVILDTTLVVISRRRRGRPVLSGARDHLTHRLLGRLGSPRAVALALGTGQAVLAVLAIVMFHASAEVIAVATIIYVAAGLAALRLLESPGWQSPQMREQAAAGGAAHSLGPKPLMEMSS